MLELLNQVEHYLRNPTATSNHCYCKLATDYNSKFTRCRNYNGLLLVKLANLFKKHRSGAIVLLDHRLGADTNPAPTIFEAIAFRGQS
jgi:hypothetical protein